MKDRMQDTTRSFTRAEFMRYLAIMGGAKSEAVPQQGGNDDHLTCKIALVDGGTLNFVFNATNATLDIWRGKGEYTLSLAVDTRRRGNMIRLHRKR